MKKVVALCLSVILLLGALSGCGTKTWTGTHDVTIVVDHYGTITVEVDCDAAPETASAFLNLAKKGFYNGLTFYRVINGFAVYGGDPNKNGTGTSGTNITGEFLSNGYNNPLSHTRGAVGMARGINYNTASCQFYIMQEDATWLDGDYALFGTVTSGMVVVDQICQNVAVTGTDGYVATANQPVISSVKVVN